MSTCILTRALRPETLTAIGIFVVSGGFLSITAGLDPLSALLPAVMLVCLMVLAVLLLIMDQRHAMAGQAATPATKNPGRVIAALALVVLYTISVDVFGFYPSTAVFVPLIAYLFGYRDLRGLALATAIVLAGIYLIFSFAMAQEFPVGRIWNLWS